MSLASKLQALVDGLEDTRQAIESKGAALPAGSPLGDYPGAVESIESEPWIPEPGTGQLTSTVDMFKYGWSQFLTSVGLFDTSNVTDMSGMFGDCSSLVEVPLFDTSNVTYMDDMFADCSALTTVPLFDTSSVITMAYMFADCSALTEVPLFDTSNVSHMDGMFYGCSALTGIELTDCSEIKNASSTFTGCTSLERLILPGMTRGFNLLNTQLSATALNDLFHSLGTASGSQTITITGAPGAATCDKSIATAKGWTITG